ncbi:hypothetical protein D3C85_1320080 [compost metagenome]
MVVAVELFFHLTSQLFQGAVIRYIDADRQIGLQRADQVGMRFVAHLDCAKRRLRSLPAHQYRQPTGDDIGFCY